MKGIRYLLLGVLLALLLAACQGGDGALGPPEIRYGEDVCDQCNMIISEPRFAAALATEAGEFRRFDDIGEMFLYAHGGEEAVRAFWVHDFHAEEWIEADSAMFVHDSALMTPMGWGVAAFADAAEAQAYQAESGGALLSYAELREQVAQGELMPQGMGMGMSSHNHDGHGHDGH